MKVRIRNILAGIGALALAATLGGCYCWGGGGGWHGGHGGHGGGWGHSHGGGHGGHH